MRWTSLVLVLLLVLALFQGTVAKPGGSKSKSKDKSKDKKKDKGGGGGGGGGGDGEDKLELTPCKVCVAVIKMVKKGRHEKLETICTDIYNQAKEAGLADEEKLEEHYAHCNEVLEAMSVRDTEVNAWLNQGCWKYEMYGEKEFVKPCPSHVICSQLKQLKENHFCMTVKQDNPFEEPEGKKPEEEGEGGGEGGGK